MPWHCDSCGKPALLRVLDQWWVQPRQEEDFEPHQWTFARCEDCQTPHLLVREPLDYGTGDLTPWSAVFPEPARTLPHVVPRPLREDWDEAQRCLSVKAFTAVALVARRIVEGMCADQGAKGRSLAAKLKNLKDRGLMEERLYDWSSLVREVGNEGAHEVQRGVSAEDARETLQFVEALLDYMYAYRVRYQEFVDRRAGVKPDLFPDWPAPPEEPTGASSEIPAHVENLP